MRLGLGTDISVGYRQPLFGGVPFLLDTYTGAAAAYSLRQLRTGVTNVVRVREDSGNTEQDFTAKEITDGTLLSFVGAGNNGHVVTWYDQSGNGNDATQSTAANQPKIVSAGALVTENGKPAILLDGLNNGFSTGIASFTVGTLFDAFSVLTTSSDGIQYWGENNTKWSFIMQDGSTSTSVSDKFSISNIYKNGSLQTLTTRGDWYNAFASGIQHLSYLDGVIIITNWNNLQLFNYTTFEISGKTQEVIIYQSDQSANRTAIEQNINDHYNIYP